MSRSSFKLPSALLIVFVAAACVSACHGFILTPRIEKFNTAKFNAVTARNSRTSSRMIPKAHLVTIEHEGKSVELDVPEYTSILDAALDAGIDLPHDCKLGVCLTCPSKVVSGEIDQSDGTLETSVQEKGFALTCVTYPRSDCVIRSIEEKELVDAQFERA